MISEAEYNIHLKNGRVITEVDEIKEENGKVTIYKKGIVLELLKKNILEIEEYGTDSIKKEFIEEEAPEEAPLEEQLPEYMQYDKFPHKPSTEIYEEEEAEEADEDIEEETEETRHKLKTTGTGKIEEGELQPGPQLKELRKQEEEGTLPEQFTPYKDFLEQQHQKQKQQIEGQ